MKTQNENVDLFCGLKMSRWYLWVQVMILMVVVRAAFIFVEVTNAI